MARCTRFTLLPESPGLDTENGESSSSQALGNLSDEPPQYSTIPADDGDNPISTGLPIHTRLGKKGNKKNLDIDKVSEEAYERVNFLVDEFMQTHPSPPYCEHAVTGNLPCPVIIPQRRPRDWKRGFMRAYAPVLNNSGISEETFMDFLKTFSAVNKYLPWLNLINFAATSLITIPVLNCAVNAAIDFAIESEALYRSNAFLNRMNEEFFKPRGLYCLVMIYAPKSKAAHTSINITQCVSSSMKSATSVLPLSPVTPDHARSIELPEAAPLVFPAMDCGSPLFEPLRWTWKTAANYVDRQHQKDYTRKYPPKALTAMAPGKQRSWGPKSWLTGKAANPRPTGEGTDALESKAQATSPKEQKKKKQKKQKKGAGRRWYQEDILYLMIVNLPTEAELEAARQSHKSKFRGT